MKFQKDTIMKVLIIIVIILLGVVFLISGEPKTEKISYNDFQKMVDQKKISKVTDINEDKSFKFTTSDGKTYSATYPTNTFEQYLTTNSIDVPKSESNSLLKNALAIVSTALTVIILFVFFSIILTKVASKNQLLQGMTKSKAKLITTNYKFSDMAGNEEQVEYLKTLVDMLKEPKKYAKNGARIPRGVLLEGTSGVGKTLIAKCVAGEAGVPFFSVAGSDFDEMYVGVGSSRMKDLFEQARKNAPCIIFVDEFDSLASKRDENRGKESNTTLNAFLTEMDGIDERDGVIVMAATNMYNMLDKAAIRPGRFDRRLTVPLPDIIAREQILKLHSQNKPLSEEVDFKAIARMTSGFSGADLENLLNESAIYATKTRKKCIDNECIDKAYFTVVIGQEKKNHHKNNDEKKTIAWHEAGHSLITKKETNNIVTKVTIIPSVTGAGGFSADMPLEEKALESKEEILKGIMTFYGGRAAEQLLNGKDKVTTGASNDIKNATKYIIRYIKEWGMSDTFGLLNIDVLDIKGDKEILTEAKKLSEELYAKTLNVLNENKSTLCELANALLEKETLNEHEINAIVEGREWRNIKSEKDNDSEIILPNVATVK